MCARVKFGHRAGVRTIQWELVERLAGSLLKVLKACREFVGSSPKGSKAYQEFVGSFLKVSEAYLEFTGSLPKVSGACQDGIRSSPEEDQETCGKIIGVVETLAGRFDLHPKKIDSGCRWTSEKRTWGVDVGQVEVEPL
ncbi:hypothetical protein BHE74_00013938 [Ensete ventricosum]|nr:hypothetical protein BHE74_00013938 [Ensete ventricosum]